LVLCGDSCEAIEDLLWDVERRLAIPPRRVPQPDHLVLQSMLCGTRWRLPEVEAIHALATDDTSRSIVSSGVLYPCQAIFHYSGRKRNTSGAYAGRFAVGEYSVGALPFAAGN
jgi:hypothetical protein